MISRRALLCSPILLANCNRTPTHQRVDPALAPLLPAGTNALIGVRLDNLRKTPAWDKLFPKQGATALDNFAKRTGMDLRTGLYEIVYCMGGKHRLALIRGKFVDGGITNSGLEPDLKIEGAQKFPYKGFSLIGKEEAAVTFFNSSVAVAGAAAAIRELIDARESTRSIPESLRTMVESLPFESDLYMVSDQPAIPTEGIGGLKGLPVDLKSAKAWVDFRTGATFHADIEGASDADAKKMGDGIKAATSFIHLTLKKDQRDLLVILDSLHHYQEGAHLKAQAEIPLESLRNWMKTIDSSAARLATNSRLGQTFSA